MNVDSAMEILFDNPTSFEALRRVVVFVRESMDPSLATRYVVREVVEDLKVWAHNSSTDDVLIFYRYYSQWRAAVKRIVRGSESQETTSETKCCVS